jgi:ABC-type polysaccharide/polyol phosphate export permease
MTVAVRRRTALYQLGIDAILRRFGRTHLGWPWLFIRSPLSAFGATFLFAGILSVPTDADVPYLLFVLVGQAIWGLFAGNVGIGTRSLDATRSVRNAVRVSRSMATASYLSRGLLELAIMAAIFVITAMSFLSRDGRSYVRFTVASPFLLALSIGLMMLMSFAISSFTAVLGQGNRDTRWSIGFILGPWMLVTPILYPVSTVPHDLQWTLSVNPAALPVLLAREALFGDSGIRGPIVVGGAIGAALVTALGLAAGEAAARYRWRNNR